MISSKRGNFPEVILTDVDSKSNLMVQYVQVEEEVQPVTFNIIATPSGFSQRLQALLTDMFLPRGYPDSVSSDYLEYQIWDTCQAFCSSISGTLSMRAVMQGIGVGSNAATPISAAITWLVKDGTGIVGSILFAWLKGSKLDSDCKKWRLFADFLNNVAMFVELYIPSVMKFSMEMLCLATVIKAIVRTAGSSTRAVLATHQAIDENIADVSAKDGSQEIFVNLCAYIFGIFVLKNVTETRQVWAVMCTACMFHMIFNYKAVKCLKLNVFNNERLRLCLRTYLPTSNVPSVEHTNKKETVFLMCGTKDSNICGFSIVIGANLKQALISQELTTYQLRTLTALFRDKKYFILANSKKKTLYISLRQNFTEKDVLKAYFHAYLIGISICFLGSTSNLLITQRSRKNAPLTRLQNILRQFAQTTEAADNLEDFQHLKAYISCHHFVDKEFVVFYNTCVEQGWNVNKHLINVQGWRADWPFTQLDPDEDKSQAIKRPTQLKLVKREKSSRTVPNWNNLIIS